MYCPAALLVGRALAVFALSLADMSSNTKTLSSTSCSEDESELRRGPWTLEEDTLLIQYIARHGEGRWNLLAKRSGLRRTGKSCRLRWLNYLKPDVKRGNLSPEEQILILDLHSKWGNRWSKIAQYLPGRTDNEIKNYWRTRVQKQARHLKVDTNSIEFQNIIRCFWMPRLLQKIGGESSFSSPMLIQNPTALQPLDNVSQHLTAAAASPPQIPGQGALNTSGTIYNLDSIQKQNADSGFCTSSCILPSEPIDMPKMSQFPECPPSPFHAILNNDNAKGSFCVDNNSYDIEAFNLQGSVSAQGFAGNSAGECYVAESNWPDSDFSCGMWSIDELWQSRS